MYYYLNYYDLKAWFSATDINQFGENKVTYSEHIEECLLSGARRKHFKLKTIQYWPTKRCEPNFFIRFLRFDLARIFIFKCSKARLFIFNFLGVRIFIFKNCHPPLPELNWLSPNTDMFF